ncbi:MAG: sortase, partial [Phototrophicaceae bacterium]
LDRVVLPTGHTFQNNEPIFNFSEIPENMRGLVSNQIYLSPDITRVNPTDDTPLRVIIPDINIDNTIVQGVDWNALQQGVGMLPNGAIPTSETDNVVLAAHNDIYGELFRNLDQLENGDELQVQTQSGFFTYIVSDTLIVDPSDVYVMESQGTSMVTLISCYPYNVNNRRIIVQAVRVNS